MTYEDWKEGRIRMLQLSNEEAHELTVECIGEALFDLMEIKAFEDITVTDIVKRAGISRTAYYKNFKSREEVLLDVVRRKCELLFSTWELSVATVGKNQLAIWTKLFELARENERYLRCVFQSGKGDMILEFAADFAVRTNPDNSVYIEYMLTYVSGAVYSMLRRWILTGMKETPEEMAEILNKL